MRERCWSARSRYRKQTHPYSSDSKGFPILPPACFALFFSIPRTNVCTTARIAVCSTVHAGSTLRAKLAGKTSVSRESGERNGGDSDMGRKAEVRAIERQRDESTPRGAGSQRGDKHHLGGGECRRRHEPEIYHRTAQSTQRCWKPASDREGKQWRRRCDSHCYV